MTSPSPSDPDPRESPDLDSGGSPHGSQTPDSDSTSLQSDAADTEQSPAPSNTRAGVFLVIGILVLIAVLMVIGVVFGVF